MEQVQIGNKTLNLLELDELNEDSQEKENKRIFVSKFISIFCVFLIIFILIPKFNFLNITPKVALWVTGFRFFAQSIVFGKNSIKPALFVIAFLSIIKNKLVIVR